MELMLKENTKYPLLVDTIAKKIFKSKKVGKEYTARILSEILKTDYNEILKNIKLISEDIYFSNKIVHSNADVVLEKGSILVNVEICYFNGPTRNEQMNSYLYELYLGQIRTYKDYQNVHKVIQIIIEDRDFFHQNDFLYNVAFMDTKHHIKDDNKLERYRINLDYLSKMTYNDIEKNELARLLYLFVCGYDKLETAVNILYKGDEFMRKVVEEAKDIAKVDGFKLYFPLTDEEIREADEQYFINQGIQQGKLQEKAEMVINLFKKNISIDTIAECACLTLDEVHRIIDENKS